MGRLGGYSGKEAIRRFQKIGYVVVRQKGSHVRMVCPSRPMHPITIPLARELKIGLLCQLISDAGLSVDDFLSLV